MSCFGRHQHKQEAKQVEKLCIVIKNVTAEEANAIMRFLEFWRKEHAKEIQTALKTLSDIKPPLKQILKEKNDWESYNNLLIESVREWLEQQTYIAEWQLLKLYEALNNE